jgi:hypothetical protein
VPLRAIARACQLPSDELRQTLWEAKNDGRLLELPHDDWPRGFPRDRRSLELSKLLRKDQNTAPQKVAELFDLTPTETKLLLALLELTLLPREREDMSCNTLYVHICNLQTKLNAYGIQIERVWGWGYCLRKRSQHTIIDLILRHVAV